MADELKEVVVKKPAAHSTWRNVIYFLGGMLEILLLFRLVFKLTAADPTNGFVNYIYAVSNVFVAPYSVFVFEPGTLVAMAVYAFLVWAIAKIIVFVITRARSGK